MRRLLFSLALILPLACGTKYTCPENFVLQGSGCFCPEGQGFHQEGATCLKDEVAEDVKQQEVVGTDAASGTDAEVGTDATDLQDVSTDEDAPDVAPDVPTFELPPDAGGKKVVGAACADDVDCLGGLQCFSWPKGYCSMTNCTETGTPCPGASQCWQGDTVMPKICVSTCEGDSDCRKTDGYGCKRLSTQFGGIDANVCAPSGTNGPGMGCAKALDCSGSNTCLTDMNGGYCARIGCGLGDPCDAGTACVLRNGKFMCMKTCTADTDCAIATKQQRKCVTKSDVTKKAVQICSDSAKSSPVGSACVADLDCDSKFCSIYAKGTCAVGGALCLTDGQCGPSGPCNLDPSQEKGICSATCGTSTNCPTGGLCIALTGDAGSGSCEPKCKGPADDASCGGVPGMICLYGQPVVTPTGSQLPAYGCAPRPAGSAGADCSANADCAKSSSGGTTNCFLNSQQNGGYCGTPCNPGDAPCPFGTVCTDIGFSICQRMCSIDEDCPPQFVCKLDTQAVSKVCKVP